MRIGNYTVELVEASSKVAFKEHFPSSFSSTSTTNNNDINAYVEVEPNAQYYISIIHHSAQHVMAKFKVDGQELNYAEYFEPHHKDVSSYTGLYSLKNHRSHEQALRFQHIGSRRSRSSTSSRKRRSGSFSIFDDSDSEEEEEVDPNIGIVEITFHHYTPLNGHYTYEGPDDNTLTDDTVNADKIDPQKKIMKSAIGTTIESKYDNGKRRLYHIYEKLQTVRLKYCSVPYLLDNGIVPKPDDIYEEHRIRYPKMVNDEPLDILPKVFVRELRDNWGDVIEANEYEMFDLTDE